MLIVTKPELILQQYSNRLSKAQFMTSHNYVDA